MESNEDDRMIICVPLQRVTINLPRISPARAVMMLQNMLIQSCYTS